MAGIHITVDTSSWGPLQHRLQDLANLDTTTLMPRLGEYLKRSTKERFKTQTDPDGTAWQALQPRTLKHKKYNKDKVLTLRGQLRSKIGYQPLGKSAVQVGSPSIYAATHQFGRGAIPARPYLGLSSEDRNEIIDITLDWLQGRMRG